MNTLRKTLEVLGDRGWTGKHGNLEDPDGSVCVLGALSYAVGENAARYPHQYSSPQNQRVAQSAISTLAATILENYPEGSPACPEPMDYEEIVYVFNDELDTLGLGVEPLIRMLEKSAAKLDEQI